MLNLVAKHPSQAMRVLSESDYRQHCGMLIAPNNGKSPAEAYRMGIWWAMDNSAFVGFNATKFNALLHKYREYQSLCLWAVAPDVVGNATATRSQFDLWQPIIAGFGYKVAFVAQNGIEHTEIPWPKFSCLFIGGDTAFKLGTQVVALIREAKAQGKWVHMGRVNSKKRVHYALTIGCDSVDGTGMAMYNNELKKILPAFKKRVTHFQPGLWSF